MDKKKGFGYNPETIWIYILQKPEIKVGDKIVRRYRNKGIFLKFCKERICLINKTEDPLIWSSIHWDYLHE